MSSVDPHDSTADVLPFSRSMAPLLLRLPVHEGPWAESLPPMPTGAGITVAFSDADVEAEHGEAVSLLGYAPVGLIGDGDWPTPHIDLLVPRAVPDRFPVWRDAVVAPGAHVWDLAFGPAAMQMGWAVAVHLAAAGDADAAVAPQA